MIIKQIELSNYERFSLKGINNLVFTPSKSNTIVGSNGSGKSSLLEQLTPFPPNRKEFDNGYKIIKITHRGKEYELKSIENKHYFIVDSENLNNGRTMKVQLNLIKEHFNLTPFIMDVLLNKKRFSKMSIGDRKDWLSIISPTDYTYALSIYKRAKDKARDIQGGIRLLNSRMVTIKKDLLTEEDYANNLKYSKMLSSEMEYLLRSHTEVVINEDLTKVIAKNINKLKQLLKSRKDILSSTYYESKITNIDINIKEQLLKLDKLKETNLNSTDDLKKEILNVQTLLQPLRINNLNIDDYPIIYNFISSDKQMFKDIINEYLDSVFNIKGIESSYSNKKVLEENIRIFNNELFKLEVNLETMELNKEKDSIDCPKCEHSFKVGFEEIPYMKLKNNISSLLLKIEKKNNSLLKVNEVVGRYELFKEKEIKLFNYLSNCQPLKNYIMLDISTNSNIMINELNLMKEAIVLTVELDRLDKELGLSEGVEIIIKHKVAEEIRLGEVILSKLYFKKNAYHKGLKLARVQEELLVKAKELESEIIFNISQMNQFKDDTKQMVLNKFYTDSITILKKEILRIESITRKHEDSNLLYDNTRDEINSLNVELELTKDIIDALSPTKGLIAKSIMGFLNMFISQVNNIISNVWSYDMKILVPEINGVDFNYKFAINVDGKIRDDIALSSTGMGVIIDLAFKIASMNFMGMSDYPIYLDEFGSSFDSEHRRKAVDLITKLQREFPQIFIISHYDDILYSLNNDIVQIGDIVEGSKNERMKLKWS